MNTRAIIGVLPLIVPILTVGNLHAVTVRTASEAYVTNKIAAAVAAIPAPDFTTSNATLVATIEEVAPAPGNYANVSNAAMSAAEKVRQGPSDWQLRLDSSSYSYLLRMESPTNWIFRLSHPRLGSPSISLTRNDMENSWTLEYGDATGVSYNPATINAPASARTLYFTITTTSPVAGEMHCTAVRTNETQSSSVAYLSDITNAVTAASNASTNYTDAAIATAATAATNYTDAAIAVAADAATNYTDAAIAASPPPDWNAAPGDAAAIVNRPAVGGIDVADYRDFLAALDTLARPLGGEVVTSSRHYVQDGLVAMWDGIENTAAGTNGLAATTWTDRVGGRAFSIPSGASFTPLGLATTYANGSTIDSSATNFLFVLATNGTYTIEVAYTQTAAISHPAAGYYDYRAIFLATGRDIAKFSVGLGLRHNNQVDCVAMTISGDCSNSSAAGGHVRALYPTGGVLGAHTVSYVSASMSAASILFDGGAQSADFDIPQGDMISGNLRALYFNRNYYTGHGLDGTYHCIRIYSRALTREEVAHNREIDVMRYHGGWRPKTSGLVNDGEDGDHPFASKQEVAAAAEAATNYTDAAIASIDIPTPGNYAAVSNAAMSAAAKTAAAATAATNYTDTAIAEFSVTGEVAYAESAGDTSYADEANIAFYLTDPATGNQYAASDLVPIAELPGEVYRIVAGTNIVDVVTNYDSAVHAPARYLQQLTTNGVWKTIWAETNGLARTLAAAKSETTAATNALAQVKADRAWSKYTSALGAPAPEGTTWLSTPTTVVAGGYEYSRTVTASGQYWFLTSNGMTLDQGATNSFLNVSAPDGTPIFRVEKTDSRLVGVNASAISMVGSVAVISVPVVGAHPYARVSTSLRNATWHKETEDGMPQGSPASVTWSGSSGAWVATVDFGSSPQGFCYFEQVLQGITKIVNDGVTELSGGIMFNGVKYMPTVNGNKLEFVAP